MSIFPRSDGRACPAFFRAIRLPVVAIILAGCHDDSSAPYEEWARKSEPSGGWAELRRIGVEADSLSKNINADAGYSKQQEKTLDAALTPLLSKLPPNADGFASGEALAPDRARIGWGEIGRVFEVKTQEAVEARNYDAAVKLAVEGTRFAFLVASGDAADSLVGFPIADSIRRLISPSLRAMSDKQLTTLAEGIEADLKLLAPPPAAAAHERASMSSSIQALQTAYQNHGMDAVEIELGQLAREPLEELKGYAGHAESKRIAFFRALNDEAVAEGVWLDDAVVLPAVNRTVDPVSELKLTSKKPWNAIARLMFMAGGPMMETRDRTLARTNLLVLTSRIVALVKHGGAVPANLDGFDASINHDPYSGGPMLFTPKGGRDFLVYSTGADGIDNGGESDDAGVQPDLVLEGST